ncbi:MAG: DUF1805 domain-containing protein [Promethearchaeota archaeon]
MSSRIVVKSIPVAGGRVAQGIEAAWEGGQWVAIICDRGMVGCGAFDVALMEAHEQVIAVAHGSLERHLVTCEDLLAATIGGVTRQARELGVRDGMTGREAVEVLSGTSAR